MSKTETSETYIGTKQAACRLHLSVQRVRKLAIDGRNEGAFKQGSRWKIPVSESGMPKISRKNKGPKGTWRIIKQDIIEKLGLKPRALLVGLRCGSKFRLIRPLSGRL